MRLPDGREPEDLWIVDSRLQTTPVDGARDLPGAYLLPGGMVDAHMHLTMNFGDVMPHPDGSDELVAANSRAQREAGVLAVRDAGCAWGGIPKEPVEGPRLQRAGRLNAFPDRGYTSVCRFLAEDELVEAGLAEVAAGAQWVKVLGDFPGPDGNWFAAPSSYSRSVLTRLVREVHAAGARVLGHSTGLGAADLVAAGVDSIEHGMSITDDVADAMAERQIAWTTTFGTAYKHVGALAEQDSPVGAYIRGCFDRLRSVLPRAAERGVPILTGTDELPMGALPRELAYLPDFGVPREAALAAGSTAARAWLRFPDVGAGDIADVVTYDADPRRDLSVLATPAAVVFGGVQIA